MNKLFSSQEHIRASHVRASETEGDIRVQSETVPACDSARLPETL